MLANLFARAPEQRAMQVTAWGDWTSASASHAGVNVSTETALNLLAVYGCVRLISDTIATLPLDVFRRTGTVPVEASKPRWLDRPNPHTDIVEYLTMVLTSLLLDGNAYVTYMVDGSFVVSELGIIHPSEVQVRAENNEPVYYVKGQRYAGRLLHLKGITRPGSLTGLSPIEAARESLGLGLAAQEFGARFFGNGIHMAGVIEVPGELSQDQAEIFSSTFARANSGLANSHKPAVLTQGSTWKAISITPEQAQFLETRKFTASEICAQMFLVDPTLLGVPVDGKSLTYANLEQRGIHLVQFTLLPWIVRLERAFNWLLPRPQYVKFNVAGLERADLKTRYEAYAIGTGGAAFLVPDEAREKEDLGPMPAAAPVPPTQEGDT